ncbi:MAG: hypothetical protein U0270_29310 [Labilithrix sp.]
MEDDSEKADGGDEPASAEIVAFFRSMSAAHKREYEELAARDRKYGEDSVAEMRS